MLCPHAAPPPSPLPPTRAIVADDDPLGRNLVVRVLGNMGFEVIPVPDGEAALDHLSRPGAAALAVLDWEMPGRTGIDVCLAVRGAGLPHFLVMLTSRDTRADQLAALEAGADDFLAKPFHTAELQARLANARRLLIAHATLETRLRELEEANTRIQQLECLLAVCAYCRRIRNEQQGWEPMEAYITRRTRMRFTHSVCPDCYTEQRALLRSRPETMPPRSG